MARRHPHASVAHLILSVKGAVTIAGGGLAGLSLANGLRLRGIPVTVHEARSYPRHRVCGEFISGVAADTLEALGIRPVFGDACLLESVAWFSHDRKVHEGLLPEPAFGISRYRLDQRLHDLAVERGAVVHERSGRSPLEMCGPGQVWATGRGLEPPFGRRMWIGLKCHFRGLPLEADLEMHLGREGYIGLARIEDERVNVCGLFRTSYGGRLSKIGLLYDYISRTGNAALVQRLREAEPDLASFTAVAGFKLGDRHPWSGMELCGIGDAERMIPPFTGNGMSMAFQSAELALDPLARWSEGSLPWEDCLAAVRAALQGKFQRRMKAASFMHPLLFRSAGRRLIGSLGVSGLLPFRPLLSLVR